MKLPAYRVIIFERMLLKLKIILFSHLNSRYSIKENYITSDDILWWEGHINNMVLKDYEA
ncbi:MAG: hypothetical protein CVV49_03580 [Spirochaetae bacterium HGW-Spirochaetae-5]|nr:MAG: hypothetical protein CVV49_03580 [Spirochaetae bacterium HGW-Spirochaetae-5]